jgi:hypothetical protein
MLERNNVINNIENNICDILGRSISVFAIGDPSEVLSKIGAERLYASDSDWEGMIVDLIKKSNLIVVRPSNSNGCLIELKHIVSLKLLDKCLFVVSSTEELSVLKDYLRIEKNEDLELFAKYFASNKVYGLKINMDGRYSSFLFDTTNNNLKNFLILYGIDLNKKATAIRLSIGPLLFDRLFFILNPLFYSSLYEWNLFQKCVVSFFMASPVLLAHLFLNGYNHKLLLLYTTIVLFAFVYFIFKAPYISQTRHQFASATHYITRIKFLLYFNLTFILSLIFSLLINPQFANSCFTLSKVLIDFLYTFSIFLYYFIKWPLILILIIILVYRVLKKKRHDGFG